MKKPAPYTDGFPAGFGRKVFAHGHSASRTPARKFTTETQRSCLIGGIRLRSILAKISTAQVLIELNRDFDVVRLTGKEIEALVMAWQSMAISKETMLHQFERGDVLPPGRSPEEELALIKANPPVVKKIEL